MRICEALDVSCMDSTKGSLSFLRLFEGIPILVKAFVGISYPFIKAVV